MLKFKTKDKVIVLKGKDKGKISNIKKIVQKKNKQNISTICYFRQY